MNDGKSTYRRDDGVLLEVYVCEPPDELQKYCKENETFSLFLVVREKESKVSIWQLLLRTFYLQRFHNYSFPPNHEEEFD